MEKINDDSISKSNIDIFGDWLNTELVTEYQTNLKELSKSPIEQWLESFTREHMNNNSKECIELLGT